MPAGKAFWAAQPHESRVYSDFSHFYDRVFGRVFLSREREVIESLALRPGHVVLEVGVGTGISLGLYPPFSKVIGIDASADMLEHARAKIAENGWTNVEVRQGDAQALDFPDNSFDFVCAFHVISVVPEPAAMMREMCRVCKPGGRIVIVNHFRSQNPVLGALVSVVNPLTRHLGWTTRLRVSDILDSHPIRIERHEKASKLALDTILVAVKEPVAEPVSSSSGR